MGRHTMPQSIQFDDIEKSSRIRLSSTHHSHNLRHRFGRNSSEFMDPTTSDQVRDLSDALGTAVIQTNPVAPIVTIDGNLDFMSNMPAEILIEIFKSSFIPIEDRMPSFDNCIEPWSKLYRHYQRTNSYRDVVLKDAHSLHLFMRSIEQDSIVQDAADIDNKLANLGSLVRVLELDLRIEEDEDEEDEEDEEDGVESEEPPPVAPSILDSQLHRFVGLTQLSLGGATTISATFFTTLFAVTQLASLSIEYIALDLDNLIESITTAKHFRHLHLNVRVRRNNLLIIDGFGSPVPSSQGGPMSLPPTWPTADHVERVKAIGDRKGIRLSGICFDIEYLQ